jgi:hypothetical protein
MVMITRLSSFNPSKHTESYNGRRIAETNYMTIQVKPEKEAPFAKVARLHGLTPEQLMDTLVDQVIASAAGGSGVLTVEDVETMLNEMAEGSEHLPDLPDSAFSRESFYEGR